MMAFLICDVCEKAEAIGVACSALGGITLAYCKECAEAGLEPPGLAKAVLEQSGGYDGLADWIKPIIRASLAAKPAA